MCFTGSPYCIFSYCKFGYYNYISIWPYYIVIHLTDKGAPNTNNVFYGEFLTICPDLFSILFLFLFICGWKITFLGKHLFSRYFSGIQDWEGFPKCCKHFAVDFQTIVNQFRGLRISVNICCEIFIKSSLAQIGF